jgi:hypothetical protein
MVARNERLGRAKERGGLPSAWRVSRGAPGGGRLRWFRVGRSWTFASLGVVCAPLCLGCTLLVSFDGEPAACDGGACSDATLGDALHDGAQDAGSRDTKPDDGGRSEGGGESDAEAGSCSGRADGGACAAADTCNAPSICIAGVCTPQPLKDGTVCGTPKNECYGYPTCNGGKCVAGAAYADGYQWPDASGDNARCCGGEPVETTTVTHCGVCGIKCGKGQACSNIGGYYFCTGCGTDNAACWSDCCSSTDSPTGHCTPSNCVADVCKSPDICPKPSHCQPLASPPLVVCTYD